MTGSELIDELVTALRCLPGVGPKSAQRMAFHLLERDREGGRRLAAALEGAMEKVGHCRVCRTFSEAGVCAICANNKRDQRLLCVVETPADVAAIEHGTDFRGLYFVLMGRLSPLDGIGPEELGLDQLARRLESGDVAEIILATDSTVEGEATAHYVNEMVRERGIRVTRIAQGIPLGGALEYVDSTTLAHAFTGRHEVR
ncbi:MAG: recombination protein RecR [Gammaproteobacteria bacterium]|nr:recombination protein RecR [Gammaproteobacteria bacterium]NIR84416.1 recombination protein RecR [Gammaproteobacteria bacterium]NIR90897.1 recombination protein RecR [Gammaproteobacteria bacterium]NIU07083.1 recombination protein RecR [Gammaproteobacteria bacterium]NIV76212.1 recombination protein RecR [Gammaproteobacteria bacterium]